MDKELEDHHDDVELHPSPPPSPPLPSTVNTTLKTEDKSNAAPPVANPLSSPLTQETDKQVKKHVTLKEGDGEDQFDESPPPETLNQQPQSSSFMNEQTSPASTLQISERQSSAQYVTELSWFWVLVGNLISSGKYIFHAIFTVTGNWRASSVAFALTPVSMLSFVMTVFFKPRGTDAFYLRFVWLSITVPLLFSLMSIIGASNPNGLTLSTLNTFLF